MKWMVLILVMVYTNNLLGQTVIIKDSLLDLPIENVTFHFEKLGVISNKNGVIDISVFNNDDVIEISHLSYYPKKITKKNISPIVYLNPKTNILPDILLEGSVIKLPISEKYPVFTINPSSMGNLITSTANLLASESSVVIQESQSGGGSPNYRGMEASRLLLILDGIPLNNTIYRSGHLQSSGTVNPFFLESISLLSGPASVGYGNGAMSGALIFKTQDPKDKNAILVHQQFESSSNAVITSFKTNYYKKNLSHITSFSLKSADNLRMGENRLHGYNDWGREAVNENKQLYTNYSKGDFIHKSKWGINEKNSILLGSQFSTSSNIYRYDRMNDTKDGAPKYEAWYYGPQSRFFQNINYTSENKTLLFDNAMAILAFQNLNESRHVKKAGETLLNNRNEKIKIYDLNLHLNKQINRIKLAYGAGARRQNVSSSASLNNNNISFYNTTRYPDGGSIVQDLFVYSQAGFRLNKKVDFLLGGRWNNSKLSAKYNNPTFSFDDVKNNNTSFVKSVLISFKPISNTNINATYYGGFRNPNVDDIGKIFSKDDINVVVPNAELEPEYADNFELSVKYIMSPLKIQIQLFKTLVSNAINREYGTVYGADSMLYDGEMMRIQMNKNIERATIKGIGFSTNLNASNKFLITTNCNYLIGKKDDNKPLAHIPPFNAKLSFNYNIKEHVFNFYTEYNGWKSTEEYDEEGVDNLIEATADGAPSWYTLNLCYSKKFDNNLQFSFSVKNILDAHYKTFASGISASGRNFVIALRSSLNN